MASVDPPKTSDIVAITVTEEKPDPNQPKADPKPLSRKLFIPKKLARASTISAILSILSFILSLPIIYSAIWLLYIGDYDCENILGLSTWRVSVEVGLVLGFIVSNAFIFLRIKYPIPGGVVVMVMLAFSSMVGLGMAGNYSSEAGHKLPASPPWLRLKIDRLDTWSEIKHCLYDTRVCDVLITRSMSSKPYHHASKLSPIERGCCNPPSECEMEYVNATYWQRTPIDDIAHIPSSKYADCDNWVNNSTAMCFDCQSCKDAFLWTMESKWKKLGVFIVTMSILLLLCHLFLFISTIWESYVS